MMDKIWKKTHHLGIIITVTLSLLKEKITVSTEGKFSVKCECSLKDFINKTDEYKMQELIKSEMGQKTLTRIMKFIAKNEEIINVQKITKVDILDLDD